MIQSQGLEFIEEEESPLIAWLLYIAREQDQLTGLMAAWTLAILYRHGLTKRGRETAFAFLLVPLLTRMLDKDLMIFPDTSSTYNLDFLTSPRNVIRERAPLVLAMLAANSAEVQRLRLMQGLSRSSRSFSRNHMMKSHQTQRHRCGRRIRPARRRWKLGTKAPG